jgi:hypothetical protein
MISAPVQLETHSIRCTASVLSTMREDTLRDERFEVGVSFDERLG